MNYLTGSAGSLENLREQLGAFAALHGWGYSVIDEFSSSISKGSISYKLTVSGTFNSRRLSIKAITPAGAPDFAEPAIKDGFWGNPKAGVSTTWPATFHFYLYDNPDLIWVALNHDTNYWQHMGFGMAVSLGCTGLGNGLVPFYYASFHFNEHSQVASVNMATRLDGQDGTPMSTHEAVPFYKVDNGFAQNPGASSAHAYVNEAAGFFPTEIAAADQPVGWLSGSSMPACIDVSNGFHPGSAMAVQMRQPNTWNNEAALSIIRIFGVRPSNFICPMFEIPHIRMVRNDFYNDGDIITLGSDKWKVASARRKFVTQRGYFMISKEDHSGTYAYAFSYTDPA